jgi:hypothetical protein
MDVVAPKPASLPTEKKEECEQEEQEEEEEEEEEGAQSQATIKPAGASDWTCPDGILLVEQPLPSHWIFPQCKVRSVVLEYP